jgi:hypothetical protein
MSIAPPGRKTAATRQSNSPTLSEPIEIAKFWKSRDHAEHVRVDLSEYKGHPLINIRIWQTGTDGIDRPSTRGIAMSVRKLPQLASALAKAETTAIELGLIAREDQP